MKDGQSPLTAAIKDEHLEAMEVLLRSGSLIDKECLDEVEDCMTRKRRYHDTMPSRLFDSKTDDNIPEAIRPLVVLIGTSRESTSKKALELLGNRRHALFDDFGVLRTEVLFAAQ